MKPYFLFPLFLQRVFWLPTLLVFKVFGHLEVTGHENIPKSQRNFIFACNHSSEIDPVLIPPSMPYFSRFLPVFYASRESKFYDTSGWRRHFYGGLFFKAWGGYPIFGGLKDYEKSLPFHIAILNDGGNLCVFPEGGKSRDGRVQEAKGGMAYLSERTGVPVIPVAISGEVGMSLQEFFQGQRHVRVHFCAPVFQNELAEKFPHLGDARNVHDLQTATQSLRSDMRGVRNVYKDRAAYVMTKIAEHLELPVLSPTQGGEASEEKARPSSHTPHEDPTLA